KRHGYGDSSRAAPRSRRGTVRRGAVRVLLGLGVLAAPAAAATAHGIVHAWTFGQGTLIPNWSFENALETWRDDFANGVTATARATHPTFAARSGRFMGHAGGATSYAAETR